jgi:hypothetical protein
MSLYLFLIKVLGTFGIGFFLVGLLLGIACLFWRKKWKWILSSILFVLSAGTFIFFAYIQPGFGLDVVVMVLVNIVFFFLYQWVGWNSKK